MTKSPVFIQRKLFRSAAPRMVIVIRIACQSQRFYGTFFYKLIPVDTIGIFDQAGRVFDKYLWIRRFGRFSFLGGRLSDTVGVNKIQLYCLTGWALYL